MGALSGFGASKGAIGVQSWASESQLRVHWDSELDGSVAGGAGGLAPWLAWRAVGSGMGAVRVVGVGGWVGGGGGYEGETSPDDVPGDVGEYADGVGEASGEGAERVGLARFSGDVAV